MIVIIILLLGALFVSALSGAQGSTSVIMCSSFSCAYNRRARCTRREIAIYDNTIIGLCLYHSQSMDTRILEPMKKGVVVEKGKPNPQMISKIMKAQEEIKDSDLIKNPKAFAKWMRRQGG